MKAKAVRLHAANDLRIDEFELPPIKDDEVLVKVISDSICMSTYKCATLGVEHKRVHEDVAEHPAIMGHEFAGDIVEVGAKWADRFKPGMKFTIQPALNYKGTMWSPGYSYEFCGGDATYCILPAEGVYTHEMGIREGGKLAIVAGAGPMGLGALTYALHCDRRPALVCVADIDQERLDRAAELFPPEEVKAETGIELVFINNGAYDDQVAALREVSGGTGFDDVLCYAPVAPVVTLSDAILGRDGCLNFFAGPTDKNFSATMNFYEVHYGSHHVMGTTGGNTDDMIESLELTAANRVDPSVMVTHVGGLDAAAETTLNLPKIPGGKKLIYTHVSMPLVALSELRDWAEKDERFAGLADIVEANRGLWCPAAERYLLEHWTEA